MLYVFGFFFIFALGGLTGVMLAIVPFDWQAHDTYFVVAHLHYVVAGALAFPMLAALYYWLPLLTGRTAVHRLSVPAFWLVFIGFNLTFFLMHLVGLLGMPRRIYTYPGDVGWNGLNLSVLGRRLHHDDRLRAGGDRPPGAVPLRAPGAARSVAGDDVRMGDADPAGALCLRLAAACRAPTADDAPAGERAVSLARGEGYLGFARNGWQETLGVHMTSGAPEQLIVLPRPTYLPLCTALATAAAVLAMLFQFYAAVARRGFVDRRPLRAGRAERRARARLWSAARRPWRERAAAYRGGRRAVVVGADLHAGRRRHAVRLAGVRDVLSLDRRAELAAGGDARAQPRARPRGHRGPRRCRGGSARIAAYARRRRLAARLDRPRRAGAPRRHCRLRGPDRRRHPAGRASMRSARPPPRCSSTSPCTPASGCCSSQQRPAPRRRPGLAAAARRTCA